MNAENSAVEDLITNTEEFIQNNPRSLGYISHAETMKSIKNLKKFGIWQILDKDETVRHFRQISNTFKINVRSLRDWHLQLKKTQIGFLTMLKRNLDMFLPINSLKILLIL